MAPPSSPFQVPELFNAILTHLDRPHNDPKPDLAACCRVSQKWFAQAVKVLWRDALSGKVFSEAQRESFIKTVRSTPQKRLKTYASAVQDLRVEGREEAIKIVYMRGAKFRHLINLDLTEVPAATLPDFDGLLIQSLQSVEMPLSNSALEFFKTALFICPKVKFTFAHADTNVSNKILQMAKSLVIEKIKMPNVPVEVAKKMGASRCWDVFGLVDDKAVAALNDLVKRHQPNLKTEELVLSGQIKALPSVVGDLPSLKLFHCQRYVNGCISTILAELAKKCPNLQELELWGPVSQGQRVINLVNYFRQLENLCLVFMEGYAFSGAFTLEQMLQLCSPLMKNFQFLCNTLTLSSMSIPQFLYQISEKCPEMEFIELTFDHLKDPARVAANPVHGNSHVFPRLQQIVMHVNDCGEVLSGGHALTTTDLDRFVAKNKGVVSDLACGRHDEFGDFLSL